MSETHRRLGYEWCRLEGDCPACYVRILSDIGPLVLTEVVEDGAKHVRRPVAGEDLPMVKFKSLGHRWLTDELIEL